MIFTMDSLYYGHRNSHPPIKKWRQRVLVKYNCLDSMEKEFSEDNKPENPSDEQEKPKTLGSGFVTSILGEGGAAVVYEIWNPQFEIHRAVKLWRPIVSEKDFQRFETEIKITSKLDHPNIVEIHTVGEWNGLPYIEMERIDGLSLQQILRTHGSLPPVVAVAIMIFICRALNYAHQEEFSLYGRKRKGVIHCDIKPANIMITRNGVVKLMDFGIANPTNVSLHTAADRVTGSLQYMAPEQIRSKQVDARTDIYSIGVVLYEILSGTKAFPSKQLLEVIEKRKANDYVPLDQFCTNLPKRYYRMVATCMQPQPEDRYQQVQELQKELTAIFKSLSHSDPEAVLQQFLEGGTVPVHKIQISRQILIPAVAAIVPTFLLIITVVAAILKVKNSDEQTILAQKLVIETQNTIPPFIIAPPETVITTVTDTIIMHPKGSSKGSGNALPPIKKPVISRETELLNKLESLVNQGNLAQALKLFGQQTVNDGAFYSQYARCLYESSEWQKAYEMAERSVLVPSKRVSIEYRKGQQVQYKAKYFSYLFDKEQTNATARSAITAWWDVREYFDGTARATFAESEINRLSAFIGESGK